MSNFNKFFKKFFPRLIALVIAAACGLAIYGCNRFIFYEPEDKTEIKFDIPSNKGDSGEDEPIHLETAGKIYNFLVMGHDRAASLTDVIMLINYNVEIQRITIMQFPRDTYIEVRDYYYHKINGLYNYCIAEVEEEGSKNPQRDGCSRMAEYLERNMAITINYSLVMDLDGFGEIVDTIGGVDMYVPQNMYYSDPGQGLYINLKEGQQHLDGEAAEQFVRYRYGYANGDLGRGDAQKLFISAFIKELKQSLSNADVSLITQLASNVVTYVDTDLTAADIVYFGKCFLGIGTGKSAVQLNSVQLMTMPGGATMYDGLSYYVMNHDYVAELMNDYFNIYSYDIEGLFDMNCFFSTKQRTDISYIYNTDKDYVNLTVYTAGALDENGLN